MLGGMDSGEDSRLIRVYTKELGLLLAKVQAARKLSSKHRYHTQDYSYGHYSFVRGKAGWRIIGSESASLSSRGLDDPEKFQALVKVSSLLSRLSPEEDSEEGGQNFFSDFLEGLRFLFDEDLTTNDIKSLETFLALKILHYHGYWESEREDGAFAKKKADLMVLQEISKIRRKLNAQIHQSLEYSHL